jgi:iron(III) transport system substrate-binding protein
MNRVLSETRAGQWLFDAISTSAMGALVDRRLITAYNAPERDAFLSEFKDPQGFWTGVFVNNLVLCYNTKMLPPKDAPKNYPDLLDPKWKGKMLMDSTDYDWFGTLATVWGKEKTVQYMNAFPHRTRSGAVVMVLPRNCSAPVKCRSPGPIISASSA